LVIAVALRWFRQSKTKYGPLATTTTISPLTFVEMTAATETDRLEVVLPSLT
jgi:hypothetical protein